MHLIILFFMSVKQNWQFILKEKQMEPVQVEV